MRCNGLECKIFLGTICHIQAQYGVERQGHHCMNCNGNGNGYGGGKLNSVLSAMRI